MSASAIRMTRSDPLPIPTGTQDRLTSALARLPFKAHLSLEPLYEDLSKLGQAFPDIPELRGTIADPLVLEVHRDTIRQLLGSVFPQLMDEHVLVRAYAPFAPSAFFTTAKYREVFGAEGVEISQVNGVVRREFFHENMMFAYFMLFHSSYEATFSPPAFVKQLRDAESGLDRFYMNEGSHRFARVSYPKARLIPQDEFLRLLKTEDLETLQRVLPLDEAVFSGFIFIRYVDITVLHNLSLLKSELVEPGALHRFDRIQSRLRSVLELHDLKSGIVLRYDSRGIERTCHNRSLLDDSNECRAREDSALYERARSTRKPQYILDLDETVHTKHEDRSPLIDSLRQRGLRSVGLIPLMDGEQVVAILELGSPTPEAIHPAVVRRITALFAPLAVAACREMDERAATIERVIKTHCTAIHPSVAWRFEEAAHRFTHETSLSGHAVFEDIIFEDVYPLYGAMDIRASSTHRNTAIQADLLDQIALARTTLSEIERAHPMPILDYYDVTLRKYESTVSKGLSSGDEIGVIEFLHTRIHPFFKDVPLSADLPIDEAGAHAVDRYFQRMDQALDILYDRRKQYEHAVTLINGTLASHLEEAQRKAQAIFPHYFEVFKSDGIEHSIYVGNSMVHEKNFTEVQLKNLRLWQLTTMCEMARVAESLVAEMNVPLRTTPLLLAQSSPLTIQFSSEEKQFVVEGSYNIRYAIMKKRIDKSTVRGTGERLTQPGQLALIYSQDREHDEYKRYFEYLADKGLLAPTVETLALEDLQGVSGLRALRAKIKMR